MSSANLDGSSDHKSSDLNPIVQKIYLNSEGKGIKNQTPCNSIGQNFSSILLIEILCFGSNNHNTPPPPPPQTKKKKKGKNTPIIKINKISNIYLITNQKKKKKRVENEI